ncbi:MAG: sugar fermentation stimulation protein A [Polaribacter sp.]
MAMDFSPLLIKATLIKRYKRFLADVSHTEMGEFTVHCPNTGSMKNCWQAGWKVWLQKSENKKRKYPYTWILTENVQGEFISINSTLANKLVIEGLKTNKINEINNIKSILSEVKYGQENSRIDILVQHTDNTKTYIEVKSVTLLNEQEQGQFPDAVTTRGHKHLRELINCVDQGNKAVLFFMVQHSGIDSVEIAKEIDPEYNLLLKEAVNKGVKVLAYKAIISPTSISLDHSVSFR